MNSPVIPKFSKHTLEFILKASRQKNPDWLDKNRKEYEAQILEPLKHLASHLKTKLSGLAPSYHFPEKGIGRIKRSANRVSESGSLYKNWISYAASRPAQSRFEHNPTLFFSINPEDEDGDKILVAGGLYMPSSRQVRLIREAIAKNAAPFKKLFASKSFASRFKGGFSTEKTATRVPRGFDPEHPQIDWIKLQAFFVWRSYSIRDFSSAQFAEFVAEDWKQVLLLNELLENSISGQVPQHKKKPQVRDLISHLKDLEAPRRKLDF